METAKLACTLLISSHPKLTFAVAVQDDSIENKFDFESVHIITPCINVFVSGHCTSSAVKLTSCCRG